MGTDIDGGLGVLIMQSVRIYEIPACKMVSSGIGMFGEKIREI